MDNIHYRNNQHNYLLIFIVSVTIEIDKLFKILYANISFIDNSPIYNSTKVFLIIL